MSLPLGPSPIQSIPFAGHLQGPPLGQSFTAPSLPGHLLHFVTEGGVRQQCNGRHYELTAGTALWYHEDEWVEGGAHIWPWRFYSINFIAPTLPPPPHESRFFSNLHPSVGSHFTAFVQAWHDEMLPPTIRLFRLHSHLLQILDGLLTSQPEGAPLDTTSQLWWDLEAQVRRDMTRPVGLKELETWAGCSAATIARASMAATGKPPMRRVKEIRLSFARGLVQHSTLSLSQIAQQIGYPRLHEFSRDYKQSFGITPSRDRLPTFREIERKG